MEGLELLGNASNFGKMGKNCWGGGREADGLLNNVRRDEETKRKVKRTQACVGDTLPVL